MSQSNLKDLKKEFGRITYTENTVEFLRKVLCKPVSVCLPRLPLQQTETLKQRKRIRKTRLWHRGFIRDKKRKKGNNDIRKQSKNVKQNQISDQGETNVSVDSQDESQVNSFEVAVEKSSRHIPDLSTIGDKPSLHLNSIDSVISNDERSVEEGVKNIDESQLLDVEQNNADEATIKSVNFVQLNSKRIHRIVSSENIEKDKDMCSMATNFHTLNGRKRSMVERYKEMKIPSSRKRRRNCLTSTELDVQNIELSENESNIDTAIKVKKMRYKDKRTVLHKNIPGQLRELPKLIIPLIKLEDVHDNIHVMNWRTKISATSLTSDTNVEKKNVVKDHIVNSSSSKCNGYSKESFDTSAVSNSNEKDLIELQQNKEATITDRPISVSDKDLIHKFKLLKELKVFLIKLDNIKNANNYYSASKIENLMKKRENFLTNTNSSAQYESRIARKRKTSNECVKDSVTLTFRKNSRDAETPEASQNNDTCSTTESSNCVSSSTSDLNRPESFQEASLENWKDLPEQTSKGGSSENLEAQVTSTIELNEERLPVLQEKSAEIISSTLSTPSQSSGNATDDSLQKSITNSLIQQETSFLNKSSENSMPETTPENTFEKNLTSFRNIKKFSSPFFEKLMSSKILLNYRSKVDATEKPDIIDRDSTENIPKKGLTSGQLNLVKKSTTNLTKKIKSFNEQSDYSKITGSTPSLVKPKVMKSPDKTRHKVSSPVYKCIVCYLCFEEYTALQQHLSNHIPKNNAEISTPKDVSATTDKSSELVHKTSRTESSVSVESKASKRSVEKNVEEESSPSVDVTSTEGSSSKKPLSSSLKSSKDLKKRAKGRILPSCTSSNCCVCLMSFENNVELAKHLYSHTEAELKEAFEQAKAKKVDRPNNENDSETRRLPMGEATEDKSVSENANESASTRTDTSENSSRHINHQEVDKLMETNVTNDLRETIDRTTKEKDQNDKVAKATEVSLTSTSIVNESSSEEKQSSTETADTIIQITRPFVVCTCHQGTSVDKTGLKIEILLLCHSCRVLFRTVECLETHYRLPEYVLCQKNRSNGRSPKLFCTNCQMVFGSVQYLRQHLEMHARMEQNPTIDFRCNICKVVFVGIGSLFYIHWSQHMKNPFFLASRFSFPKNSLIDPKSNRKDTSLNDFLHVAEHICNECKSYFGSEAALKKHLVEMTCKKKGSQADESRNDEPIAGLSRERPKIHLVCGFCNNEFLQKTLFYEHVREKHGQHNDPDYVCVSLTNVRKAYICNICVNTFDTLDEFDKHWITHLTRESFICMRCQKCCNSFESFEDHANQHISETIDKGLACKIVFNEHEFQLVREASKSTPKKSAARKKSSSTTSKTQGSTSVKEDSLNSKKKSSGKQTSAPVAKVKPVSAVSKPCEAKVDRNLTENTNLTNLENAPAANMQTRLVPDVAGAKELNAEQERSEKQKRALPLRSKEKDCTSVIDNTEDDSEHELTIDVPETMEESDSRKHEEESNRAKISGSKSNTPLVAESPAPSKDAASTAISNPSDTLAGTSTSDSTTSTLPTYIVTPSTLPQYIVTASTFYPSAYSKTGVAVSSSTVTITPMLQPVVQIHAPTVNIPPAETLPVNDKEKVVEAAIVNVSANSSSVGKEGNNTRHTVKAKIFVPSIPAGSSKSSVSEKDSTVNQAEPVVQREEEPPKVKHGFLRVKSLAELMPKAVTHNCSACGLTFGTVDALSKHSLVHGDKTQKSADVATTDTATRQSNVPPARSKKVVEKSATNATTAPCEMVKELLANVKKLTAPMTTKTSSTNSLQIAGSESQPGRSQIVQRQITSKNQPQVNSSMLNGNSNKRPPVATTQNSTSAYHKNLPACNFARASVAVPLSTIQKGERGLAKRAITKQDHTINQSTPSVIPQPSCSSALPNVPSSAVSANSASKTARNAQIPQTNSQTTDNLPMDTFYVTSDRCSKYKCVACPACSTTNTRDALTHKKTPGHLYHLNQYTDTSIKKGAASEKSAKMKVAGPKIVPMANNNQTNFPNKSQKEPASQTLTSSLATRTNLSENRTRTTNKLPISNTFPDTNIVPTTNTTPNSNFTSVQYQQNLCSNDGGAYITVRPTVSNVPAVTIPQQNQTYQPQFYTQSVVYSGQPLVSQQQMYNFPGSANVNSAIPAQYEVPVQRSVTSYGLTRSSLLCCPYCDITCYFATNDLLQIHINTFHNFICETCNRRWFTRKNFNIHLLTHNVSSNTNRPQN